MVTLLINQAPHNNCLYPYIVVCRQYIAAITRVDRATRLHEQDLALIFGHGFMFHTFGNNEHLTGLKSYPAIPKFNHEDTFNNDKHFICIGVVMPDELTLYLCQFDLVIIQFGDNPRRPVIVKF